MKFLVLVGLMSLFASNAYGIWWGDQEADPGVVSPVQIYQENAVTIGQMKRGVKVVEKVVFSKVVAPESTVKRSWGRLKLNALNQIKNFYLEKKISEGAFSHEKLYRLFFKYKSSIKIKGGWVVKKAKTNGKAELIYGVAVSGIIMDLPSINEVHRKLKALLFNRVLRRPCDYYQFADQESRVFISREYSCFPNQ